MIANLVKVDNPLDPIGSRSICQIPSQRVSGLTLPHGQAFIVLHNGQALMRADWDRMIEAGDIVHIIVLPRGGGGGSNPLRIVAMLAVTVLAFYTAGLTYGAAGAFGAGSTGGILSGAAGSALGSALVTSAVMMAGSMLVNSLLPSPSLPSSQQATQAAAPSPTYNLQAQGNHARIGGAIPEHFGRMRCFPDFAANPYIEYAGNEQYVYSLLCVGQGYYDIEAIQIEDTNISGFEEIEYEILDPGDPLTLFPANVTSNSEVSGQELLLGSYIGPFAASPSGTVANYIAFDVVMPRGLYFVNTYGVLVAVSLTVQFEARQIDDTGAAIGSWEVLGTRTFTYKTTTPQRVSTRYHMTTTGRYECRATRTDTKQTGTSYGHEVVWSGLRSYLPETLDYGDVTLLALRMRASNNLSSQAARKVNIIATRKLPVWNGTSWSAPVATSSISWALAYMCKSVGLSDARIGLAELLALDAIWSARGDEFNARFDSVITFWEAIGKVALTGRAKNYMQGGIVRTVRDGVENVPVAMFSMRNIVKGSFGVHYLMPTEEVSDFVETTYFDRDTWSEQRVNSILTDSTSVRPAKVQYFGVTDRDHAYRDGLYLAATNRYRRKIITFETEMEGFIPSLLDPIIISHDMVQWGQSAEAKAWDAGTLTLNVSEPLEWTEGLTHYIGLRTLDGGVDGPYEVVPGLYETAETLLSVETESGFDDFYIVTETGSDQFFLELATSYTAIQFLEAPAYTPYVGLDYERTHIAFGPGETWRQPAKVIAIRPRGLYHCEIEAVNEDQSVHTAEDGVLAPPVVYSQLPNLYTVPTVRDLTLRASPSDPNKALMSWTPAPGADSYQIEVGSGDSPDETSVIWTRIGETTANNWAVTALYGTQTLFRIRAIGMVVGPWKNLYFGSESDYMWFDDTALMWDVDDTILMWSA